MATYIGGVKYVPGDYGSTRPGPVLFTDRYINEWSKQKVRRREDADRLLPPSICFSRKLGVGALEVADLLAKKTGLRVVDREIIELMAEQADLRQKTVGLFDERYPGKMAELLAFAFGEKSFVESDYARHLFRVVLSVAGLGSTIFVGRGTHLILPRHRVLAVRFVASDPVRIKRLARVLNVKEEEVARDLSKMDSEQHRFFRRVFSKKEASPYEFDLVVNCDHIHDPAWAAEMVELAFKRKFASEL